MIDKLTKSLIKAHPGLSGEAATRLATTLFELITEKVSRGEQIASVRTLADGSLDLSILQVEPEPTILYPSDEIEQLPPSPIASPLRNDSEAPRAHLKVQIPAPESMEVGDFFEYAIKPIKAINFIYEFLTYISSGINYVDVRDLCRFINQNPEAVYLERIELFHQFDEWSNHKRRFTVDIYPLQVVSMHYGSPISFDLLGIGNLLEVIRDIGKDAVWRANHEKLMAKSEQDLKGIEIEKAKLEIANQKMALEKMGLELALQRVELVERLYKLPLQNDEKMTIASVLVPRIIAIVDKKPTFSLVSETIKKVG